MTEAPEEPRPAVRRPDCLTLFHCLTEFRTEAYAEIRHWLDRYVRDGEDLPDLEPHGD